VERLVRFALSSSLCWLRADVVVSHMCRLFVKEFYQVGWVYMHTRIVVNCSQVWACCFGMLLACLELHRFAVSLSRFSCLSTLSTR
jgi:hypothetical protein